MRKSAGRRARVPLALAAALIVSLVAATAAQAHAVISPPVAKSKQLQVFTLSVPTEKANAGTTKVELDPPSGFSIDSFEPAPGWKRQVTSTGSGDNAVTQKVIWTGGKTPTGEDSVFAFNASTAAAKTYRFRVQQTYSDGSVVDWSGSESSDSPAPTVQSLSSFAGGSNTLSVIALIVGALSLLLSIVALAGGRRSWT